MISVSAGFLSAARASSTTLTHKVEVQWNGTDWTDETAYVRSFTLTTRVEIPASVELSQGGMDGVGTISLANHTQRFSAWRADGDSTLRTYLESNWGETGIRVRISIGVWVTSAFEYCPIFNGLIYSIVPDGTTGATMNLRESAWRLYQDRKSTQIMLGWRVEQVINELLDEADWYDTYTALLDTSVFVLPVAWLFDDVVGKEIYLLAASESGRVWVDAYGNMHFESAAAWVSKSVSIALGASDVKLSPPSSNKDQIASEILVEFQPRNQGARTILKQLDTVRIIPPGGSTTFELRLEEPAYSIVTPEKVVDYWIDNGAGVPMNDIAVVTTTTYAQKVDVTISNPHTVYSAVVKFFSVRGTPLVGGPSEQVRRTIDASPLFQRVRSHTGDIYVQTKNQATYLAGLYAARYGTAPLNWNLVIPGLPHLEIGDRVTASDGLYDDRDGHIIAITHNFTVTNSGLPYTQNITLIDRSFVAPYANDYFIIGTSTLGTEVAWF